MRFLGIDYGTKRVGLALTNESGAMAFPHSVIKNSASLTESVADIIEKERVDEVVVGSSLTLSGKENILQKDIDDFVRKLSSRVKMPIHLEPEQLTTQEALRTQGRTEMTDASAAAIILNSYISRKRKDK